VSAPGTDPLLLGLAAGDERAFAALYDRFAPRMYRVALRILGSREDAEDVVQEVFLATVRVHERLADVRDLTA
jgi:RNA polymerase sigma-70 factor (ECF subfamily)